MKDETLIDAKSLAKLPNIEVPPQEQFDEGQATRFTTVIKLSQLLDQISRCLGGISSTDIIAEIGSIGDKHCAERCKVTAARWRDAFIAIAEHMNKCHDLMETEIAASKSLLYFYNQAKQLPSNTQIMGRVKELTEALDKLEQHRKSGLLEAITKL